MSKVDEKRIREALRQVVDPELGADIVDLNMIREINITGEKVKIGLVLTAPGCPLSGWITQQIKNAVSELPGVNEVEVELLDEPWEPNSDWKSWFNSGF